MALRQRGKNNFYHCYFRTVMADSNGHLHYAVRTVNLGTSDLRTARALEAEIMRKNTAARLHQRATAAMTRLEIEAGLREVAENENIPHCHIQRPVRRRLKLADAVKTAEKYRAMGRSAIKAWRAFSAAARQKGASYMDEVTPEMAFDYLAKKYTSTNGKSFNTIKGALNAIFKITIMDSGIKESPFAKIPNRAQASRHQRPFSEAEFVRIYNAAAEPWKSATLIAWFTGLREKDVFSLRWEQISDNVITTTPAKTARFGRAVRIPVHPQLAAALEKLPHTSGRVLGAWKYNQNSGAFYRQFSGLLKRLGICDNELGIVTFNSFRDSFVTRCDEIGMPRHALRGIVGHVSDSQTDLYSHDLRSAEVIKNLPRVEVGEK